MNFKASLSLTGILIPLFALFLSVTFALTLQLSALIQLSLSLNVSLALPTIAIALGLVVQLIAEFNIALTLGLPSLVLDIAIAIDFELVLVLGFLVTLEALIDAVINASLVAYGWFGSAQDLGAALTTTLGGGWPDGTAANAPITAFFFVATATSGYTADQIESLGMMPAPPVPPAPDDPPPPDGAYPPPQAYETGLAGITISAPNAPGGVQATGTVTVDDSVATGIGAITSIDIVEHGSGYTAPPTVQVTDTVPIVSEAPGPPIVLTLPRALTVPIGSGLGISIADAAVPPVVTQACAKVASPTTIELYSDQDMTIPLVGGPFAGGTVTGGGAGAAALVTMGGGAPNALKSLLDGLQWPTSTGLAGGVIMFRAMFSTLFSLMLGLRDNLQARANILGSISVGVTLTPPTIAASLELLASISATLTANLAVTLPSLSASIGAAISAQITAIADLTAGIGFFLGLGNVELEIWEYTGTAAGLGAAVAAGPGGAGWHGGTGPTTPVTAAVFGLTNPASAAAFSAIFSGATA